MVLSLRVFTKGDISLRTDLRFDTVEKTATRAKISAVLPLQHYIPLYQVTNITDRIWQDHCINTLHRCLNSFSVITRYTHMDRYRYKIISCTRNVQHSTQPQYLKKTFLECLPTCIITRKELSDSGKIVAWRNLQFSKRIKPVKKQPAHR